MDPQQTPRHPILPPVPPRLFRPPDIILSPRRRRRTFFFFFFPSCPYFSPLAVSRLLLALYIAPVMFSSLASIHLLVVLLIPSHLLSAPTILHSPCPSLAQFRVPPHFRQFPPFVRIHSRPPVLRLFPPRIRRRRMFSRELSQKLSQKFNIAQRSHTHIWTKLRHKICNY